MRLNVAARVVASYTVALLLLLVLDPGGWLAGLLATVSWPLLLLAVVVSLACPTPIAAQPLVWAAAAVVISLAAGFASFGLAGLIYSGFVAVPAAVLFVWSLKKWPLQGLPRADNTGP